MLTVTMFGASERVGTCTRAQAVLQPSAAVVFAKPLMARATTASRRSALVTGQPAGDGDPAVGAGTAIGGRRDADPSSALVELLEGFGVVVGSTERASHPPW
jgi:hypothetical protein